MTHLNNDWDALLAAETEKPYMDELRSFLTAEYRQGRVYPRKANLLNSLALTPYSAVKVVILGQDPYHQPGQAQGLSFSVPTGVALPPSLRNIFKELENTVGTPPTADGDLTRWAKQGVLLLNTVLSVREGQPGSHRGKGWERFTDHIISLLNERETPIVFLLWGSDAKQKQALLQNPNHCILTAPHPSPLSASRGFFGCDHFRKANRFLEQTGQTPIQW